MKRPKLRKASKRMTCAKRFKIQKKVREHHKKVRREAKKKGTTRRVKKDPGVPSSAPFKEEVLREAEQRRQQIEEQKEKQRQVKKEARAQKRKAEKEGGAKEPSAKKARQVEAAEKRAEKKRDASSQQSMCSELNKVLQASDVVLEVLDARDPPGCRCPELEEEVLRRDKKLVFLLTRIDLVPRQHVERWLQLLQKEAPVVVFKASTRLQLNTEQSSRKQLVASNDIIQSPKAAACLGGSCLTELLSSYADDADDADDDRVLKVGVVGFPNVGKSSVINGLKGALVCPASAQRGSTRRLQEVHVAKKVKLLDSPGLVAAPDNPPASLALRSLQVEEGQLSALEAVRVLLKQCDKTQVVLQYNVPDYRNSLEFLTLLAKKRNFQKKGVLDTERAAHAFLSDWTGSRVSFYCKSPDATGRPGHMTDAAVARLMEGWNLTRLQAGNTDTLNAIRFPNRMNGVGFVSPGPTSGLLSVDSAPAAASSPELQEPSDQPEVTEAPPTGQVCLTSPAVRPAAAPADTYDFNTDFK